MPQARLPLLLLNLVDQFFCYSLRHTKRSYSTCTLGMA
jgi:hypothetical protein